MFWYRNRPKDIDKFIETVKAISNIWRDKFRGYQSSRVIWNWEKVEELDIPVMHDDQHGTAIISSAALLNALN
jgi:malate dehydrogenase (oxaloacetate-decarboxylating)(NADP+)